MWSRPRRHRLKMTSERKWNYPNRPYNQWNYPNRPYNQWNYPNRPYNQWNYPNRLYNQWNYPNRLYNQWNYPNRLYNQWNYPDKTTTLAEHEMEKEENHKKNSTHYHKEPWSETRGFKVVTFCSACRVVLIYEIDVWYKSICIILYDRRYMHYIPLLIGMRDILSLLFPETPTIARGEDKANSWCRREQ
jgi:hypothetical protein